MLLLPILTSRWDGESDSLAATLSRARPDVFPVVLADPIPVEMPVGASRKRVCLSANDRR